MEKETFLTIIQGQARWPGQAQKIWEHAIKVDEKDTRWAGIYDESESPEEVMRQYCREFGITYQKPARNRKSVIKVERIEKKLAQAKECGACVDEIRHLEKELRYWQSRER